MKQIIMVIVVLCVSLCEAKSDGHPVHGHHKRPARPRVGNQVVLPMHQQELQEAKIRPQLLVKQQSMQEVKQHSSAEKQQEQAVSSRPDPMQEIESQQEFFDIEFEESNSDKSTLIEHLNNPIYALMFNAIVFSLAALVKVKTTVDIHQRISAVKRMIGLN